MVGKAHVKGRQLTGMPDMLLVPGLALVENGFLGSVSVLTLYLPAQPGWPHFALIWLTAEMLSVKTFSGLKGLNLWQWLPFWGMFRHPQTLGSPCSFNPILPEGETYPVFMVPCNHMAYSGWCSGAQNSDPRLQSPVQTRTFGKCSAQTMDTGTGCWTFCPIQVSSSWLARKRDEIPNQGSDVNLQCCLLFVIV